MRRVWFETSQDRRVVSARTPKAKSERGAVIQVSYAKSQRISADFFNQKQPFLDKSTEQSKGVDQVVARITHLPESATQSELRDVVYTPGFMALLKTNSPMHTRTLHRLFTQGGHDRHTCPLEADFVVPTRSSMIVDCSQADDNVMLVVEPLVVSLRRYTRALVENQPMTAYFVQGDFEHAIKSEIRGRKDNDRHSPSSNRRAS